MNDFVLGQAVEANGLRLPVGWKRSSSSSISEESLRKLRNERRRFKNISIYVTELPATPLFRISVKKANVASSGVFPVVSRRAIASAPTPHYGRFKRHPVVSKRATASAPTPHYGRFKRQPASTSHCGRHGNDWLFGGFSVTEMVKGFFEKGEGK
jgi:hypothetical protein